ncbi:MAG: metallophosphoesterase [Candidatus Eisenbacteria bacterium]|nr:metallophosphoesterase [Candidatus Eisenbacteria bacterium]
MTRCLFVSDLHGREERVRKLFGEIARRTPAAVFVGGDIMPHHYLPDAPEDFLGDCLFAGLDDLRARLGKVYPKVFTILGNDDGRWTEERLKDADERGLLVYAHGRATPFGQWTVYGYAYVPPTPFRLKDWERYDVSRHLEPGCVSPEEGARSVPVSPDEARYATILEDLGELTRDRDLGRAVFLFHAPPYDTDLDRAALDDIVVDHVPVDVHIGSIAIRRFIEERRPYLTLHGHVHESARLTGSWRTTLGGTTAVSAAHDGPELAVVGFDMEDPSAAERELL